MATETTGAPTDDHGTAESMVEVSAAPMDGPVVQIVETDEYGPILVDGAVLHALRVHTRRRWRGESTCVDDCAGELAALVRRGRRRRWPTSSTRACSASSSTRTARC